MNIQNLCGICVIPMKFKCDECNSLICSTCTMYNIRICNRCEKIKYINELEVKIKNKKQKIYEDFHDIKINTSQLNHLKKLL